MEKELGRVVFYMLAFFAFKVSILIGIRKAAERMERNLSDPQEN